MEQTQLNTALGLCREQPQAAGAAPVVVRGALGQRTPVSRCRALPGSQHSSVPLPYLRGRSRISGTALSSASFWLLSAPGGRDFPSPRTQRCGLRDQHTEIPTHRAQAAQPRWPVEPWQHWSNLEENQHQQQPHRSRAGKEGLWLSSCRGYWSPPASAVTGARAAWSTGIKPSPAQGEQPDGSWLSRSRAQTRCDCASDSAEWRGTAQAARHRQPAVRDSQGKAPPPTAGCRAPNPHSNFHGETRNFHANTKESAKHRDNTVKERG